MKTMIFSCLPRALYIFLWILGAWEVAAQTSNPPPKWDEVYKLLREHAAGVSAEELDQASVRGLLNELRGRAAIIAPLVAGSTRTNFISKALIYDKAFAYFRIEQVGTNVGTEFSEHYGRLAETNKVKGVILDLRFADGEDYAAAAALADQFLTGEQPLLDWGKGAAKSTTKSTAITVPVTVLVNRETRGAAEALAAVLHETKAGLLLGSTTAGQASIFQEFSLQDGQKLRIAVSPVKVGPGTTLTLNGLKPDIEVLVNPEDEKNYLADPYQVRLKSGMPAASTNSATHVVANAETNQTRGRVNEAELVRRHREGLNTDEEFTDKPVKNAREDLRLINDPVLNRALDLLKGLSVVQQTRPL